MNTKWMPQVAGILNIISGVLSLLGSVFIGLLALFFFASSYDYPSGQELSAIILWLIFFLPLFVFSVIAIVGGVFALRRKVWGLALAGSICSILTMWSWPLGIASVVFISMSKHEFNRPAHLFPASVIPGPSAPDEPPHQNTGTDATPT